MRQGQNRRMRGRNRKGPNPLQRSYESNGPDVKVRGNPQHIAEKYVQLARDAQSSGDPVMAENYFQHAEHYYRIVLAAQEQMAQQYGTQFQPQRPFGEEGEDGEDEGDEDGQPYPQGQGQAYGQQGYAPQDDQNDGGPRDYQSRDMQPRDNPNRDSGRDGGRDGNRNNRFDRNGNRNRFDRDRNGPDRNGQDRNGQDRGNEERQGQNRNWQDRPNQDRPNQERNGQERPFQDRPFQDRNGQRPREHQGRDSYNRDQSPRDRGDMDQPSFHDEQPRQEASIEGRQPRPVIVADVADKAPALPAFVTAPRRAPVEPAPEPVASAPAADQPAPKRRGRPPKAKPVAAESAE